jgi:small conductance mechanosensitive channel
MSAGQSIISGSSAMQESIQNFDMQSVVAYISPWLPKIGIALLIFVLGRWVARLITNGIEKGMSRAGQDITLVRFLGRLIYTALLAAVLIAALDQLGVQTTSLLALLGAAGLAVGLALQGSLSNFASGVMLILFRPFKVGDFVEAAGVMGSVEEVGVFATKLVTADNRSVIVPNRQISDGVIVNFSAKDTRRVDLSIGVSYSDDLQAVRRIILGVLEADARVLEDPAPTVLITGLGESSVDLAIRPWCASGDYWSLYDDLYEQLKVALEGGGCSIPFPQREIHMVPGAA